MDKVEYSLKGLLADGAKMLAQAGIDEADFGNWIVRAFLDGDMIKEDNIIISGDGINIIGI